MLSLLWEATFFGLVSASILALATVGFTVQFGVTNCMNFAFGALMTLAAFLDYTIDHAFHWSVWLTAAVTILASGLISVLLNRLLIQPFKRKGAGIVTLLMVTFSLNIIVQNSILAIWGPSFFSIATIGDQSLSVLGLTFSISELAIIALSVVAMIGFQAMLTLTDLGKAIRAISDDATLARLSGVRTAIILDGAWLLSGCLGGLAGLALALNTASFDAATGTLYLPSILAAALLGGVGRPIGAVIGAVALGLVTEWTAALAGSQYSVAAALAILVLVLVLRPNGLVTAPQRLEGSPA